MCEVLHLVNFVKELLFNIQDIHHTGSIHKIDKVFIFSQHKITISKEIIIYHNDVKIKNHISV